MGHRLSKIYTRTGDNGTTGLGDGSRVAKDHLRVETFGTVDELNCIIGMIAAYAPGEPFDAQLQKIQHSLFDLGGELCIPGRVAIEAAEVQQLEQWLDALNDNLAPLKEFILPGGTPMAAVCHLGRTVCRRAERLMVGLAREEAVNPVSMRYINRLSDFLFVMARALNQQAGRPDILWQPKSV